MSATDNHTPPLAQDPTLAVPQFHPLVFPLMEGAELEALAADIGAHDLVEPIILYEDKILDGRNRYLACSKAGIEPRYLPFLGDDPFAFVISANLHRRHLTSEQKRALIDKLLKADPTKSDRQIANTVKVDNKTDATRRELAEARGEIPHVEKRTDTKGRQQPRTKKAKAPAAPSVPQSAEAEEKTTTTAAEAQNNEAMPDAKADTAIALCNILAFETTIPTEIDERALAALMREDELCRVRRVLDFADQLAAALDDPPPPPPPPSEGDADDSVPCPVESPIPTATDQAHLIPNDDLSIPCYLLRTTPTVDAPAAQVAPVDIQVSEPAAPPPAPLPTVPPLVWTGRSAKVEGGSFVVIAKSEKWGGRGGNTQSFSYKGAFRPSESPTQGLRIFASNLRTPELAQAAAEDAYANGRHLEPAPKRPKAKPAFVEPWLTNWRPLGADDLEKVIAGAQQCGARQADKTPKHRKRRLKQLSLMKKRLNGLRAAEKAMSHLNGASTSAEARP